MDRNRLIQCQGDNLAYIKHLELRIIELESTCSSRYPEAPGSQQQISGQCRPCEVCRNLNLYTQDVGGSQEISSDSLRLVPESCHNNQSSQHNNRPPGSTLTFIPYEGPVTTEPPVTTDSSTLTHSAKQQWSRLVSFTSSLSDLPRTSRWKKWTSTSEYQRKNIVLSLVSGLAFPNGDNPIAPELPVPISILLEYSKSMEPVEPKCASAKSAKNRPFACFQELIFCSMCAVALEVTPKEIVFEAMQSVFQSDAESKTLRTRIHGAKWANRAIYLLSRTEWGSRSWDLIYAANNRVNFYRQFNDYSITPDDLITNLKIEVNPEDTQTISVPLAIPSIIRTIFRGLVPLKKICECLGYELHDYNKLDLSGLEKLLVVPANTDPDDTGPNKKRKNGPIKTSSKRRCRDVSSGSPEGHYFETSNGSHCSIHTTPAPSAPGSCSDSVMDGLFEEFPASTSSPTEGSLDIDANEEMVGSRVGDANCSPLTSNHSTQQSIFPQSQVDVLFYGGDNIPDIALPSDTGSRTSSAVIIPDSELESRADQLSTTNVCFGMNGTLDLESNSSSNMSRSTSEGLRKSPRLERSRPLSLPSSQRVNQMPSQMEYADQVSNGFQDKPPLDDNLARPFEDLDDEALKELFESLANENLARPFNDHFSRPLATDTGSRNVDEGALNARPFEDLNSWSWDTGSQNIHDEALNEFQFEALRDENIARPFEDLDDEALKELFESLANENLARPFNDHFSRPLATDTGSRNVDEEEFNARPFEFTFSQPPPWDMGSQDFAQGLSSFQDTSPTNNNLAHHSTRPVSDDESRYMSEGWNGSRFLTPTNTSHAQPAGHHFSRYTGFDANESFSNLQNEICAN